MQQIVLILLIAFVGWVIWSVSRPRYTFVVTLRDGVPELSQGKLSSGFLHEIAEICTRHGVREGVVRGVNKGNRIGLSFSGDLPEACQQQLRNVWNLSTRRSIPAR